MSVCSSSRTSWLGFLLPVEDPKPPASRWSSCNRVTVHHQPATAAAARRSIRWIKARHSSNVSVPVSGMKKRPSRLLFNLATYKTQTRLSIHIKNRKIRLGNWKRLISEHLKLNTHYTLHAHECLRSASGAAALNNNNNKTATLAETRRIGPFRYLNFQLDRGDRRRRLGK